MFFSDYKWIMPEKPQEKKEKGKETKKLPREKIEKSETEENSTWEKDQAEKSYYYDDAYGYEVYNADEDDEENEI